MNKYRFFGEAEQRKRDRTAKVLNTTIDELFSFDDEEWTED